MNLYSSNFLYTKFFEKKNCMVKSTQNQEFTGGSKGLVWGRDLSKKIKKEWGGGT